MVRFYPIGLHSLALSDDTSDFGCPPGGGGPPNHRSAIPRRPNRLVHNTPPAKHGRGHNNRTSPTQSYSPLAFSDDAPQQVHRMYHIYSKNLSICVIPAISVVGLFGEFGFPLVSPAFLPLLRHSIAISQSPVAVWRTNSRIPRKITKHGYSGVHPLSFSQCCKSLRIPSILSDRCSPGNFATKYRPFCDG